MLFNLIFTFLPCVSSAKRGSYTLTLSVRLSVRHVVVSFQQKQTYIMLFTPNASPDTLVFGVV